MIFDQHVEEKEHVLINIHPRLRGSGLLEGKEIKHSQDGDIQELR